MWRYLPANKGTEGPRNIFSVDTETNRIASPAGDGSSLEVLRLGVARFCRLEGRKPAGRYELAFNAPAQFWSFVASHAAERATNWIFAHGMGFDLRTLHWPEMVDSGGLSLTNPRPRPRKLYAEGSKPERRGGLLVLSNVPVIADCWLPDGRRLRLVDTRNWWNIPLARLGDWVGLPKLEMPEPWAGDDEWLTYCRRDCEILEAAVVSLLAWHRDHDLGVFRPTAPGQSMQCYRHRFMRKRIVLHDVADVKALERSGYYAGRLATFYSGEIRRGDHGVDGQLFDKFTETAPRPIGPLFKLDSNSLFPFVMRGRRFPCKLLDSQRFPAPLAASDCGLDGSCLARVLVRPQEVELPVRVNGRVVHAVGEFETVLCGPELQAALDRGDVLGCIDFARYELADLFSSFVDYFWQLRFMAKLAQLPVEAGLCKLMLNSLYGKFAQLAYEWEVVPGLVPPEPWHHWTEIDRANRTVAEYRSIGETVQRRQPKGDHAQSFTAISAWITAYARERMRALRSVAGWHNVYYQGVDSLFVSPLGLERLTAAGEVDPARLGALRLEGEADSAAFMGLGVYRFGGQWTRCSIRRGAIEIDPGEFKQDRFEGLETSLAKPPSGGVRVAPVVRQLTLQPETLGCTDNGWVRPLRINLCDSTPTLVDAGSCCDVLPSTASYWLGNGPLRKVLAPVG